MDFLHRIHICSSGDLAGYKTEMQNAYNSGLFDLQYVENHVGREFNRRCDAYGATDKIIPHSGHFRPYDYAASISTGVNDIVLIGGDDIRLIDGGDMLAI